jgi:hypothetical protein
MFQKTYNHHQSTINLYHVKQYYTIYIVIIIVKSWDPTERIHLHCILLYIEILYW